MSLRLVLVCLCALPLTVHAQNRCAKTEVYDEGIQGSWGYGVENHRFQANTAITPANVHRLKRAWVYKLDDKSDPHSFPLVTADSVIVGSRGGVLHALDKATGCLRWQYDAGADIRTAITAGDKGLLYFGTAAGGAFDVHGAFVDEKMVFISSGYDSFDQKGGNAFVAFKLPEE